MGGSGREMFPCHPARVFHFYVLRDINEHVGNSPHLVAKQVKGERHIIRIICLSETRGLCLVERGPTVRQDGTGGRVASLSRICSGGLSECSIFHVAWLHFR